MSVTPIDLRDIALESDILPADATASIRIRARAASRGGELLRLHDESIGTYARVFLGRMREARGWRSVAIKLQRDEVASDFAYDNQIVSAKFDEELANHLELQRARSPRHSLRARPSRTVRLLPRPGQCSENGSATLFRSEILPPCLFCLRARHALRLLGRDGEPLHQGAPSGSQRYLESSSQDINGRRYYSDHVDDLVRSTVGRDQSACNSCEHRGGQETDSCIDHVRYVNLFENRILFYEPLDLSLHDALRWWRGERRPLAARSRRALLAIEKRARRLRSQAGHETPDEALLRSILDLRLRIDLFQQTLEGVESLHTRGIPHLDINPENICLKVRNGRVHGRLIDLGMAANPEFTTKDQYEKRLWPRRADFAAEECQRLGIFSSRQFFIRISKYQLASRIPVCRGDQLLYEGSDGLRYRKPFEIVSVAQGELHLAGFGVFPFLCEVDGSLECAGRTTAMELRIIPRRGPAADIFSLGMILVSLLFHETSGDDFRRELGKIEESLFSHWESVGPDPQPIPARILVHRVLARPEQHSRWFRERVESLNVYGQVTPLAEELLGTALRALLRTTHHHPYLVDRGTDARLALRRLMGDVRAVRRALDADLLAVRHRAMLARRQEALRQIAARCQVEIPPLVPDLISDARYIVTTEVAPLLHSLRMVAASPATADAEAVQIMGLPLSRVRIAQLLHHLDPTLDPKGPERLACIRSLWSFLEWLHRPAFSDDSLQKLRECWERRDDNGDRSPIHGWRDQDRELAGRLASDLGAIQLIDKALEIYDQRIARGTYSFWRRAIGWYRITLPHEEYRILARGRDSIELLDASRIESDRRAQQLRDRFEVDLERWRHMSRRLSETWMGEVERQTTEYLAGRLSNSQDLWSRSRATLIPSVRSFFEVLTAAMGTPNELQEHMIIVLSKVSYDAVQHRRAMIPSVPFTTPLLGPAFNAEADFILRRLAALKSREIDDSPGEPRCDGPQDRPGRALTANGPTS